MKFYSKILVISAPSGAGKTSIIQKMAQHIDFVYSVSHTTRMPRRGEQDGQDYYFVNQTEFLALKEQGAFLETAYIHGHYYGTSWANCLQPESEDAWLLLDLDSQGFQALVQRIPHVKSIFIMPPSIESLRTRILMRQPEIDQNELDLRLANALKEIEQAPSYNRCILNDNLDRAVSECLILLEEWTASSIA